jgi:hypothetical protein
MHEFGTVCIIVGDDQRRRHALTSAVQNIYEEVAIVWKSCLGEFIDIILAKKKK